jgi:dihydroflavonol-4-reductase
METVQADLNDREALEAALRGVDAVIHCAGYYPRLYKRTSEELATAKQQMENFCQAVMAVQCKKVVYVSAASILNKAPDGTLAHEDLLYREQPAAANPFRVIKWSMEQIAETYIARGLPMTIAIPSMVFGEYDYGPTAGRLIVQIANGKLTRFVACNRNIIYGPELAEGLIRCVEAGKTGERYILAGNNISMKSLVEKIAQLAHVPLPKEAPLALAHGVAWLQDLRYQVTGKLPSIKPAELRMLTAGQFLDTSKAKDQLGFVAKVPVDEAITLSLRWFKQNGYISHAPSI